MVLVVTDVLVSPSSVVIEFCDGVSLDSGNLLNHSPLRSPKKRSFVRAGRDEI